MNTSSRKDGRQASELRPFAVEWDPMGFALSSVIVRTGQTAVLCSVCREEGVPRWRRDQGLGWLSAEYRLLPGSTPERQRREWLKLSGRTQEIQRLIGRSLRAVIDLQALGERQITVDCDVIQADGGTRTAAITGAWVALKMATAYLIEEGVLKSDPVYGQLAAISCGVIDGETRLDLEYEEDSSAEADANFVLTSDGGIVEIQATAEDRPMAEPDFLELFSLAKAGVAELSEIQLKALEK